MDHKKEHIIETGRDLFEKKGYYNTSMQDVAEACGISKATLYKLFRSKEDFSMAIICYMVEQMLWQHTPDHGELAGVPCGNAEKLYLRADDRLLGPQSFHKRVPLSTAVPAAGKIFQLHNKLSLDIFLLFQQIISRPLTWRMKTWPVS